MSNANERPERALTIHEFGEAENNSTGTSTRLATALRYGEAGLPIVPLHGTKNGRCTCGDENCERRGRHPRAEEGRVPYATTDATIIRKYWTDWPNAAIAVETGKWDAQNIVAVMITREDVNAPQTDQLGPARPPEWVKMEGEAESHTVMFRRGKRDVFLFRAGPGGVPDGKLKLAEGVTIFGKGEYVRPAWQLRRGRRGSLRARVRCR
jgi:Bifunctional DNA primase/polymerase, N-terminal